VHTLMVAAADVNGMTPLMLTVSSAGSPAHTHTVMLSAAQLMMLRNGTDVTVTSSTDSQHNHMYRISCT